MVNDAIAQAINNLANAVTSVGAHGGTDANGGHVTCLTEAMMGITGGLVRIAETLDGVADAIDGLAAAVKKC
jgi:hypothetical protein